MINRKNVRRFTQNVGNLAVQLLYPPRCPLCDEIRPMRRIPKETEKDGASLRFAFPGECSAQGVEYSPVETGYALLQPAAGRSGHLNNASHGVGAVGGYSPAGGKKHVYPESQRTRDVLEWVCEGCREKLPWVTEPACMKCGKPLDNPQREYCEDCARVRHLFDGGRAAFTYSGAMRKSVYRMKAQNRRDYLDFYAEAMALAGEKYLRYWKPEVIVPIPMHWKKRAARGYNQSELLAEKISRLTGIPCEKRLLRCVRYTGNQKELGRDERRRNLRGSFEVGISRDSQKDRTGISSLNGRGASLPGKENSMNSQVPECVLLIDDVYTTGSTMDEAARALRAAGVRQICFLVLCTGKGKKSLHDTKSVLY